MNRHASPHQLKEMNNTIDLNDRIEKKDEFYSFELTITAASNFNIYMKRKKKPS